MIDITTPIWVCSIVFLVTGLGSILCMSYLKSSKPKRPKILLIGHARHGKDTVAEMLTEKLGLTYVSSSMICAEEFIFDMLKNEFGYETFEECFEDRDNHRPLWHHAIALFCYHMKDALFDLILYKRNMDMYVGCRNVKEVEVAHANGMYDICIWVDALDRRPPENSKSFNIGPEWAEYIVNNNGPEEALDGEVDKLVVYLKERFSFN